MNDVKKTVRTFSFMIVATLIGKVLGLIRVQMLAAYYGKGIEANAFLAASKIPQYFFEIALGAALISSFIPVFNNYLKKYDKKEAIKFANNFINIATLISILIAFIGICFSPMLVRIIAKGYDVKTYNLTVQLTRIMFPMMIFAVIAYTFVGILQSFDEFNVPAAISIVSNLILIIYFVIFNKKFGIYGLAVAMVIGWICQMVIQLPFAKKKGYRYNFYINFHSEGIKKVIIMIGPILISTWVQPINDLVNTRLASYLHNGDAVSILSYASNIYFVVVGIFTLAVSNLIFPSLSRSGAGHEYDQFKKTIKNALNAIIYFMFPLMVGFLVFRVPLIRLMYERGQFTHESTMMTSIPLFFYSFGMIGYGMREVMNRAFYSLGDSKTPMYVAVTGIILNIILSVTLVKFIGIGGLALSSAISVTFIGVLLIILFQKKRFYIWDKEDIKSFMKIALSSVLMGLLAWYLRGFFGRLIGINTTMNLIIVVMITVCISIIIYFILTYVLRLEEPKMIFDIIYAKIGKNKDKEI